MKAIALLGWMIGVCVTIAVVVVLSLGAKEFQQEDSKYSNHEIANPLAAIRSCEWDHENMWSEDFRTTDCGNQCSDECGPWLSVPCMFTKPFGGDVDLPGEYTPPMFLYGSVVSTIEGCEDRNDMDDVLKTLEGRNMRINACTTAWHTCRVPCEKHRACYRKCVKYCSDFLYKCVGQK